ncbi:hypothetical protein AB6A40_004493 [Gnathostoma spinigerum]|uniref:Uncharacterized protein n=1 Tax=Gnathostoma spinigerum TaxID=75299 RepID=A0ABD6EI04_9BILA
MEKEEICFSPMSDINVEPSAKQYGSLSELIQLLRITRIKSRRKKTVWFVVLSVEFCSVMQASLDCESLDSLSIHTVDSGYVTFNHCHIPSPPRPFEGFDSELEVSNLNIAIQAFLM